LCDTAWIVFTAGVVAAPLAIAAAFCDTVNDKPWGYRATPATYARLAALSLGVGAAVWWAARRGAERWEVGWRCLGLGVLAATGLALSFCLWGSLVLDDAPRIGQQR
jgi:uncharacterized membrane protein